MAVDRKSQLTEKQLTILESEMQKKSKNLVLAYVLLIFLGGLGIHKFYLGKTKQGIKYLVLGLVSWILLFGGFFWGAIGYGVGGEGAGLATWGFTTVIGLICSLILSCFLLYDLFTLPSQTNDVNEEIENEVITQLLAQSNANKPAVEGGDNSL